MNVPSHSAGVQSIVEREALLLAPYAMRSADSAGRLHREPDHPYRGPFQRDRDRIVHSGAYRRLSHKTQVFTHEMGDYHRNRLTHTLEVASIARTLGRALKLNEDLIEALALAHDIGHPPFGHSGEDALDECLADHGGFNHNRQALRIVEVLESRYEEFPGLNLSREVLAGQQCRANKGAKGPSPLLEVQVVDAADSIAYDTHDADDAMETGLLGLDELLEVPLWAEARERLRERGASPEGKTLRRAVLHELMDWQVGELLEGTLARIEEQQIASVDGVHAAEPLIQPNRHLAGLKMELEAFLFQRVYRHREVVAQREVAQQWLRTMFAGYLARPELLPLKFQRLAESDGLPRATSDYLAGMTDRFAEQEFLRHFSKD